MDRRTLLKAVGVGGFGTVSGCSGFSLGSGGVTPTWRASIGAVVTADVFGDVVVAGAPSRPGAVTVLDPVTGRVEWRCDRCTAYTVGGGWLFVASRRGGVTGVEAYSGPYTREWLVGGEFEAVRQNSVFVWDNDRVGRGEYRGALRVIDRGGTQQWEYGFDHVVTGAATTHRGDGLYAVVTNGEAFGVEVHRLDPQTGVRRWREAVAPGVLPRTVFAEGTVYIGTERSEDSNDASVTAVTPRGGRVWRQRWDGYRAVPEWVGGETVVVSTTPFTAAPATVRGLDRVDGSVRWVVDETLFDVQGSTGYCFADGVVVVRALSTGVETGRIDLTDHLATPARRWTGRIVGDTLVVVDGESVASIELGSGDLRWRFTTDDPVRLAGVDAATVYAGVGDTLVALPRARE